jgi:murein DD-endopeptidase MepM/ murein hydrolase activator NlpD
MRRIVIAVLVLASGLAPRSARAAGAWPWPVVGPVIRAFEPPDSPFGRGHRGIDVAVPFGTPVLAPAAGVVTFSGPVGGQLFLTIDHGGGLTSSFSWLSRLVVRRNAVVVVGDVIALTGWGHPGEPIPHLHVGIRLDDVYQNPVDFLAPLEVWRFIRLAPFDAAA